MEDYEINPKDNLSKGEWECLVKYYLNQAIRQVEKGNYPGVQENIRYAQMRLNTVSEIEIEETWPD